MSHLSAEIVWGKYVFMAGVQFNLVDRKRQETTSNKLQLTVMDLDKECTVKSRLGGHSP